MAFRPFGRPPILFAAIIIFPVLIIGGITLRGFYIRNFNPQEINFKQLSAVRNLKGTWAGRANFNAGQNGRCTLPGTLTLVVNNQTENGIAGTLTFNWGSGTYTAPASWKPTACNPGAFTSPIAGSLVGTRIENINFGRMGIFSGSYTQDTITLNQTLAVDNGFGVQNVMNGPANLLRQK